MDSLVTDLLVSIFDFLSIVDLTKMGLICRRFHSLISVNNWDFWKKRALRGRIFKYPFNHLATQSEAYLRTTRFPLSNHSRPAFWHYAEIFGVRSNVPSSSQKLIEQSLSLAKPLLLYFQIRLMFKELESQMILVFNPLLLCCLAIEQDKVELLNYFLKRLLREFKPSELTQNYLSQFNGTVDQDAIYLFLYHQVNLYSARRCFQMLFKRCSIFRRGDLRNARPLKHISPSLFMSLTEQEQDVLLTLKLPYVNQSVKDFIQIYKEKGLTAIIPLLPLKSLVSLCKTQEEKELYMSKSYMPDKLTFCSFHYPNLEVCHHTAFKEKSLCPHCPAAYIETPELHWWHSLTHPFDEFVINVKRDGPIYCYDDCKCYLSTEEHDLFHKAESAKLERLLGPLIQEFINKRR